MRKKLNIAKDIFSTFKNFIDARYKFTLMKGDDKLFVDRLLSYLDPVQYRKMRYHDDDSIIHYKNRHKKKYRYVDANYYININNKALLVITPSYNVNDNNGYVSTLYEVVMYTRSEALVKHMYDFALNNIEEAKMKDTELMTIHCNRLPEFYTAENVPLEKLIVCKHKTDIYEKLRLFINSIESTYHLSLSPRIGFLFYGKPGTGKSKVALQMMRQIIRICRENFHYGKSTSTSKICYSPYCDIIDAGNIDDIVEKSDKLQSVINRNSAITFRTDANSPGSSIPFIIIDEIDLIVPDRSSDVYNDNKKLYDKRLSLLLRLLEMPGIFIATTNHIENLDPALIRTGRFDYKYEFDYFNHAEACQLCENYGLTPEECGIEETSSDIPPSDLAVDILNVLKKKTLQEEVV